MKKHLLSIIASAFALVAAVGLACALFACAAPRSATMCLNSQSNEWVKCPAGVSAGQNFVPKSNSARSLK